MTEQEFIEALAKILVKMYIEKEENNENKTTKCIFKC